MPAWQSLRRAATILLNAFCKTGSWKLKRHLAVRHQNYLVDRADLDLRKLLSICYSSNTVMTLSRHIRGLEWTICRATVGREVVGGLGIEQHLHFSRKWFLVLLICWQLSALLVQKSVKHNTSFALLSSFCDGLRSFKRMVKSTFLERLESVQKVQACGLKQQKRICVLLLKEESLVCKVGIMVIV